MTGVQTCALPILQCMVTAIFKLPSASLSSAKIIKILGIKMILMIFNTDNIVCLYWFCNDMLMVVPVSTLIHLCNEFTIVI